MGNLDKIKELEEVKNGLLKMLNQPGITRSQFGTLNEKLIETLKEQTKTTRLALMEPGDRVYLLKLIKSNNELIPARQRAQKELRNKNRARKAA